MSRIPPLLIVVVVDAVVNHNRVCRPSFVASVDGAFAAGVVCSNCLSMMRFVGNTHRNKETGATHDCR